MYISIWTCLNHLWMIHLARFYLLSSESNNFIFDLISNLYSITSKLNSYRDLFFISSPSICEVALFIFNFSVLISSEVSLLDLVLLLLQEAVITTTEVARWIHSHKI
ncbi:unnamed protein product [Musa textilis]